MFVTTTPDAIAAELGRDEMDAIERAQIQRWIDDAAFLIRQRVPDGRVIDPDALDYVVRKAVIAVADRPGGGVQSESIQVDDGMHTTRYERGPRRVTITPEWWKLLGLSEGGAAFSVDMAATTSGQWHTPWCNLPMGGSYCSCGTPLTRYEFPLWEVP